MILRSFWSLAAVYISWSTGFRIVSNLNTLFDCHYVFYRIAVIHCRRTCCHLLFGKKQPFFRGCDEEPEPASLEVRFSGLLCELRDHTLYWSGFRDDPVLGDRGSLVQTLLSSGFTVADDLRVYVSNTFLGDAAVLAWGGALRVVLGVIQITTRFSVVGSRMRQMIVMWFSEV